MDAANDSSSSPLHIVVFPWLAFGHILPCLELAERLASRGHHVSFVSTPRNLARLRPVASLVDLVALPLPQVDGLPDGAEATCDVPAGKLELLMEASDGLAAPFAAFLDSTAAGKKKKKKKVDWLVIDSFHCRIADVAHAHDVPCALSMPYSAAAAVQFGIPDPENMNNNPMPIPIARRFVETLDKCQVIAYRSCCELEPESMPLLPDIFGKPVIPLGLLPPPPPPTVRDPAGNAAMSWLDAQPPKSVLFVAFGSEYPMTGKQPHEMALALELAGTRFLWALKDGVLLPPGFEDRTRGRGMVATGWVPQTGILAHGATAAYMTHCGWGSAIEALQRGLPMVMLPALVDHLATARLMAERGVGVNVPKDDEALLFRRDSIAGAIRAVMCDEEGSGGRRIFAANARSMQEVVADKCHERHVDEFVRYLRSYKLGMKEAQATFDQSYRFSLSRADGN